MKKKRFAASLKNLPEILQWVEVELKQRASASLLLSCEEAIVNIIRHGYGNSEGPIEIAIHKTDGEVHVVIKDEAPAFNPLTTPLKENSLPLEERQEGGLGILLMRKYADDLFYERKNGNNILTLIKKISY